MRSPGAEPQADLLARLSELTLRDQQRLGRRLEGIRKIKNQARRATVTAEIVKEITAAESRVAARRASVPKITYPEQLPVSQKRDAILEAVRDHQVVIVAGETGSGKTTQLPKICLELGRGVRGQIGHTQPRRLAARTVAERIAEELDVPMGAAVGYKVRFTDHATDNTLVKLMTDGILLAEIQSDRRLLRYDTLIIDEAHERSLNIDFLLGYVKQLLPQRPDLKVIITSATIDPERFSRHFGDAPIIEVSGRTYPVEVRYRPLNEQITDDEDFEETPRKPSTGGEERDQIQGISDAVQELQSEGPGDILVFLSGEREIRDTADALNKLNLRNTEILPLYARLSAADQHRVFQPPAHSTPQKGAAHPQPPGRRVVLATNVAETSLTVPGIKYVIDPGTARISRYSTRLKVQRLPIEAISQASANQRKGRCGRTSDGICIRLYSEDDFASRQEFTDPEILRTNLASVILQMTAAGLGEIEKFPFIDPPDRRNIKDGVDLLHELGALKPDKSLTETGRTLSRLPVDPRLGRMILEAEKNGCVREVMVIAAALSIQDPRERPSDKQQAADQQHARFRDPTSDFLSYLALWNYLREKQKELSGNQFRRMCKAEFLHYLRIREWQDLFSQLRQVAKDLGITLNNSDAEVDPARIHTSLLSGLLSHIGLWEPEKREYGGARNARFAIFPGSALFKKPPRWVMSAELVETSRLWARVNARIEPDWIEPLAQHLVKRTYSEPHWEKNQGAVMAYERVTLYGVPIVTSRKVNYGRIDPELSRDLFIRHALVEGDWETHHRFFAENRKLLGEVEELENRARRRDILVDDETLFDFYDRQIPAEVVSGAHFDSWWKKARQSEPDLLNFEKSMLINTGADDVREQDYPDYWQQGEIRLRLTYQFEPGADADGVTVHIPLSLLNQVREDGFDWLIPGLRAELVTALIRSLPKQLRRNFVPAPDVARAALARLRPRTEPLLDGLERELKAMTGVTVAREAWQLDQIPDHLRMTYRVVGRSGGRNRTLAEGKSLPALKARLAPQQRATLAKAAEGLERGGIREWDLGTLPRTVTQGRLRGYPALTPEKDGKAVAVKVFGTEAEQHAAMWKGTRQLILLNAPSPVKMLQGRLSNQAKLTLARGPHGSVTELFEDCTACAADHLIASFGGPAWDAEGFRKLYDNVRADLYEVTSRVVTTVERILAVAHEVELRLRSSSSPVLIPALSDIRAQLGRLVYPGFVTATGWRRLPDLVRYLRAIERRLDRLPNDPHGDRNRMLQVQQLEQEYEGIRVKAPDVRWMLEEYRVSLFAQQLGTPYPVSDKRIRKAMNPTP